MKTTKSNDPLEECKAAIDNPKMPMVLRVGIIGHRKLSADQISHSMTQLEELFDLIASILSGYVSADNKQPSNAKEKRYHTISHTLYDLERYPTPIIRLTSALATGADRLGMHQKFATRYSQQLDIEYAAIVPFASNIYLQDFSDEISKTQAGLTEKQEFEQILSTIAAQSVNRLIELDGVYDDPLTRDNAYTNCAKRLIEHSDFVIAVYDESHTRVADESHTAGTKQAIEMAISESRPIVQIDPTGKNPTRIIHSKRFGCDKGEEPLSQSALNILLSRIALFADVFRLEDLAKSLTPQLEDRYDTILRSASHYYRETSVLTHSNTPADYDFKGPVEKIRGFDAFQVFRNLLTNKDKVEKIKSSLLDLNDKDIPSTNLEKQNVPAPFFAQFLIADALAVRYASIHRRTYLLIYLLASIAMISVAIGIIFKETGWMPWVMAGVKVFALAAIFRLYIRDHSQHHLWLQSRCLAEAIRPNTYFSVFGRCFSFFDRRSNDVFSHREVLGHSQSGGQWVCMHSEAVNRYIGFSHCQLAEEDYKSMAIQFLRKRWLGGQITYHKNNAAGMKQLADRLSAWTLILFGATVFFVAVKIGFLIYEEISYLSKGSIWYYVSKVTTLLTLFFPIVGTSIFAIRNHAEFDISAQRSLTMLAFFNSMMDYFRDVEETINHSPSKTSSQVDQGLNKLAEVSVQEVADWLEIYEVKESEPG